MRAPFAFLAGFAFMTFLFWLGGFDFNERSKVAALWFVFSTVFGVLGLLIRDLIEYIPGDKVREQELTKELKSRPE